MLEVEIYPVSLLETKQPRKKKEKESQSKQQKLNHKNAIKNCIRTINCNFTDEDVVAHLTFSQNHLPKSEEELEKIIENFLRRLRYHRNKQGLTKLKYVVVMEYKEASEKQSSVRMHIHIVMNGGLDRDFIEKLWKLGRANVDRLQADEYGFEALARYIMKDPKGKKRWRGSKNLKKPVIKVNDHKYSKRRVGMIARNPEDNIYFEKEYKGYTFNKCDVVIHEYDDAVRLYIKMRRLRN